MLVFLTYVIQDPCTSCLLQIRKGGETKVVFVQSLHEDKDGDGARDSVGGDDIDIHYLTIMHHLELHL